MKKILFIMAMLAVLMCVFALSVSAEEVDGVHYSLDAKNKVATVSKDNRTATAEIASIPSYITYDGVEYKVTKIANDAFAGNKTVKEIRILSEFITAIPYGMIINTYDGALEKIYIDFSNITKIDTAGLNPSDQSNGNGPKANNFFYYDAKAFLADGSDVIITEPDFSNCTSIGAAAFQGANFEKVVIPAAVSISNQMFRMCAMKELIVEGENRQTIGYYNFQACKNLEKVTIKSRNLKSISNDNFAGDTAVTEIYIDLSKCEEVGPCAFTFATKYDAGQTRVQWYNLEGEKIVDLSSMKTFRDSCFASSNLGSAKIIWPRAIEVLSDQSFRKCNINQPMIINAAEGVNLKLHYWCFNENAPTLLLCNEGVTEISARFSGTTAVFLADSLKISDSESSFKSGSTLYCKSLTEDSRVPSASNCTIINITSGTVNNYGVCGIVANVTTADGEVTVGTVTHTTTEAIDNALCPVGKVLVTDCKFCDFIEYTVDGEAVEAKEHIFDLENGTIGSIVYDDYFSMGFKTVLCADCSAEQALDTATEEALFVSKGISAKVFGDDIGIIQGYEINRVAIGEYKKFATNFDFGILAYANKSGSAVAPKPGEEKVVDVVFDEMANDYIEIMLTGVPAEQGDVALVFCIYAVKDGKYYYLNDGVTSETVVGNSYNEIVE